MYFFNTLEVFFCNKIWCSTPSIRNRIFNNTSNNNFIYRNSKNKLKKNCGLPIFTREKMNYLELSINYSKITALFGVILL